MITIKLIDNSGYKKFSKTMDIGTIIPTIILFENQVWSLTSVSIYEGDTFIVYNPESYVLRL
jgi:hypothetical protein